MKCPNLFSGKIRKTFQWRLLKILPRVISVKKSDNSDKFVILNCLQIPRQLQTLNQMTNA